MRNSSPNDDLIDRIICITKIVNINTIYSSIIIAHQAFGLVVHPLPLIPIPKWHGFNLQFIQNRLVCACVYHQVKKKKIHQLLLLRIFHYFSSSIVALGLLSVCNIGHVFDFCFSKTKFDTFWIRFGSLNSGPYSIVGGNKLIIAFSKLSMIW